MDPKKPEPKKFRAIIFDIGRVLVRLDIAGAMGGLAGSISLTPQETWAAIEHDPRWRDWQEGRMSPRDWQLHMCRRLGVNLTFEQFSDIWNRVLDPTPVLDSAFLARLSKRYCLAVLSNTDPIHVAHFEANYPFVRLFPVRVYSCRVGSSKPSPVIYYHALREVNALPEETMFIDDMHENVVAAASLGINAFHFTSADELLAEFSRLGLWES